jgi:hypothetical protein
MEKPPGQEADQGPVQIAYRAEIFLQRDGEEMRLVLHAHGSSIRELAEDLLAKASELESEVKERLDQAETEKDERRRAERSGRRRRSWE